MSNYTDDYIAKTFLNDNPGKTFMNEAGSKIYYLVDRELECYYATRDKNFRTGSPAEMIEAYQHIQDQQNL